MSTDRLRTGGRTANRRMVNTTIVLKFGHFSIALSFDTLSTDRDGYVHRVACLEPPTLGFCYLEHYISRHFVQVQLCKVFGRKRKIVVQCNWLSAMCRATIDDSGDHISTLSHSHPTIKLLACNLIIAVPITISRIYWNSRWPPRCSTALTQAPHNLIMSVCFVKGDHQVCRQGIRINFVYFHRIDSGVTFHAVNFLCEFLTICSLHSFLPLSIHLAPLFKFVCEVSLIRTEVGILVLLLLDHAKQVSSAGEALTSPCTLELIPLVNDVGY
mmetsp:Transcript_34861/g.91238  ORF Transcript_34861/g.91238 Transcript_34861/m.91238 type:complete len:271 (-) Transcript_34861:277-1089(-)